MVAIGEVRATWGRVLAQMPSQCCAIFGVHMAAMSLALREDSERCLGMA